MTSTVALVLIIGLLLGALLGAASSWFVWRARSASEVSDHEAQLQAAAAAAERARAETAAARQETAQARAEAATARERAADTRADVADAQADRAEAVAQAAEVRAQLARALTERDSGLARIQAMLEDHQRMKDQFLALSSDQLTAQGKVADEAAAERQKAIDALLGPLTTQLKDFQHQMAEMEKERVRVATELRDQVLQVTRTGESVQRETAALTAALRKPQVRGQWGEMQLKRAAELAGMVQHCHFAEQQTTTTSTDATIRPDMQVFLGDDKFLYVDSKVPLTAFLDAQEATVDAERERLLSQFTKNVRSHIDQLSGKQYWKSNANTPEFVVLFIPTEALAAEAMSRMPDLLEYASNKGIVVATPTSLIGLLKTVAYSWRQAALAENAQQVFELARELYDRLGTMGGHVDKLGRALNGAVKAYNESVGSLESRVLPTARKLRDLNVSSNELGSPRPVELSSRPLTAAELVEAAEQSPTPLARLGTQAAEDDDQPLLELTRGTPSVDDLARDATQREHRGKRRLG